MTWSFPGFGSWGSAHPFHHGLCGETEGADCQKPSVEDLVHILHMAQAESFRKMGDANRSIRGLVQQTKCIMYSKSWYWWSDFYVFKSLDYSFSSWRWATILSLISSALCPDQAKQILSQSMSMRLFFSVALEMHLYAGLCSWVCSCLWLRSYGFMNETLASDTQSRSANNGQQALSVRSLLFLLEGENAWSSVILRKVALATWVFP